MEILEQKLLELISKNPNIDLKELKRELKTDESENYILENNLYNLEIKGLIYKNKNSTYCLVENKSSICCGKVHIKSNGNITVIDKNANKVIIPKDKAAGILDKDIICAKKTLIDKNGNIYGEVDKILKRNKNQISCEVIFKDGKNSLIPYNSKSKSLIKIDQKELDKHGVGSILLIRLTTDSSQYDGVYEKEIGHKDEPDMDEKTIAYDHGFEVNFTNKAIKELDNIPSCVDINKALKEKRRDLRNKNIFTIDGADTKDIDDSIGIELLSNGNYKLYVNIADVSYYVKENTKINEEAYKKATSIYMNDTVVPMLPHKISNGICSLHPHVDRLTKTCEMIIDKDGKVIDYDIYNSIINSKKKMTYEDVNKILVDNEMVLGYEEFYEDLINMNNLSLILNKAKKDRGYLHFSKSEIKAKGKGQDISFIKRTQQAGENLIENFMLLANKTVAEHIYYRGLPFIYRIHEAPDEDKIRNFLTILKNNNYEFKNCKNVTSNKYMQNLVETLGNTDNKEILSELLLINTMKKAKYSNVNLKHYGLALKFYTHFTSPIRRYADLQVHRLLNLYDKMFDFDYNELDNFLGVVAAHCSERSNEADKAELEAKKMRIAEYMENNIGKVFNAYITSVSQSGITIRTEEGFSGSISIKDLDDETLYYDPINTRLYSSNKDYLLGMPIKIKVKDANKKTRTVNFVSYEKSIKKDSQKTKKRTK